MPIPCPCTSQQPYSTCCGPYIGGTGTPAPTAAALMRSRYTAFTQGNTTYIEATQNGPAALAFNRTAFEQDHPHIEWLGLTIHNTTKGTPTDTTGTVTFTAHFTYKGHPQTQSETSRFLKKQGHWLYTAGK